MWSGLALSCLAGCCVCAGRGGEAVLAPEGEGEEEVLIAVPPVESASSEALVAALVAMVNEAYSYGEAGMWAGEAQRTAPPEVAALLAAGRLSLATGARSGELAGCVCVDEAAGELGMLAVATAQRGRGLAGRLVAEAEARCAAAGRDAVRLQVRPNKGVQIPLSRRPPPPAPSTSTICPAFIEMGQPSLCARGRLAVCLPFGDGKRRASNWMGDAVVVGCTMRGMLGHVRRAGVVPPRDDAPREGVARGVVPAPGLRSPGLHRLCGTLPRHRAHAGLGVRPHGLRQAAAQQRQSTQCISRDGKAKMWCAATEGR